MKHNLKITLSIALAITLLGINGCNFNSKDNTATATPDSTKTESNQTTENNPTYKLLVDGDWNYYDTKIGETIGITFCKDGSFMYNCSCGEPVGNSDLYDMYSYENDNTILAYASDDETQKLEIKILHSDDMNLLLQIENDIIEFHNEKTVSGTLSNEYFFDCEKCMKTVSEYDANTTILNINEKGCLIAPEGYDGDIKEFQNYKRTVPLAENVEIQEIDINIKMNDSGIGTHTCETKTLTKEELIYMIEEYSSSYAALVTYNDKYEISKIVLWGALINYE